MNAGGNSPPKLGGVASPARARAKRKRDSAQPQEIGRSLKRSPSRRGGSPLEPPRPRFRSGTPPNLGGEEGVWKQELPSLIWNAAGRVRGSRRAKSRI